MKSLKQLQELSLEKRKIILWVVVIIIGIFLFFVWIKVTSWRLKNIQTGDFLNEIKPPTFNIPKIEMPVLPTNILTFPTAPVL